MIRKYQLDDPEMKSKDLVAENLDAMKGLFPSAFTEGKIDFSVLRQLLGDAVEESEERYGLSWHGKREARQSGLASSAGTLLPQESKSSGWNRTHDVFIEGDNLEALRLLQKSYAGRVKLIYIDPPYNTGKDFVYPDNYRDGVQEYLRYIGELDLEGNRTTGNSKTGGRFHSRWLSMMLPRLMLARELLAEDGSIWISIDDNELHHTVALCAEVFGLENHVGTFIWQKRTTRENRATFSTNHDYIVCFARDAAVFQSARNLLPMTDDVRERYENPDNDPRGPWQSVSLNAQGGHATKSQFYSLTTPSGRVVEPPAGRCWIVTKDKMDDLIADNRVWFGESGSNVPRRKSFLSEAKDGLTPHTLWLADEVGTNDSAKKHLIRLFDGAEPYDTPKPVELIQRVLQIATSASSNDLVVDFFAGSGTVGEAVWVQNQVDGGNRRFLLVQLPTPTEDNHGSLSEVSRSRLRAATKLFSGSDRSFGFRAYALAESCIRPWNGGTSDLRSDLLAQTSAILPNRTDDDLATEVLLKLGFELTHPCEMRTIAGKTVRAYSGVLYLCFDAFTDEDVDAFVDELGALHQELTGGHPTPSTVIFRDDRLGRDSTKTNLAAGLEHRGLGTIRSL